MNCKIFIKTVYLYISIDLDKIDPSVEFWDATARRISKFDCCHLLRDVSEDQTVLTHLTSSYVQLCLCGLWAQPAAASLSLHWRGLEWLNCSG